MDHYLGKETVQNILVFRFANSLFERAWNREAIDHIQITVAESIGVESRGSYYEESGAIRDIVQNHMLQVLSFLAMEPPRSLEPEAIRDETVKLLSAVRPLKPEDVVRGQYSAGVIDGEKVPGYRQEQDVAPDSEVETYAAVRAWIDNWRWSDVPIFMRTGKRLARRATEIAVVFQRPPAYLFEGVGLAPPPSDHLVIRIAPTEGLSFDFQAKKDGPGFEPEPERMTFSDGRPVLDPRRVRATPARRDAGRSDAVHPPGRRRARVGSGAATSGAPRPGALLPCGFVGTAPSRGTDRAARVARGRERGGGIAPTVTRLIDVSLEVGPDLLVWPGNPGVTVTPSSRISQGGSSNVSEIRLGSHTGTHIDPPFHFLDDGATAEDLPLDVMMGETTVADLRGTPGPIGPDELAGLSLSGGVTRLLLRTDNSALWAADPRAFPDDYVCLSPEGARWVVDQGVRLIGIDFLSIEARGAPGHPTHRTLLEADVVILEGLDLSGVEPGGYTLVCFPLKIVGGDGAPTRAVLLKD